MYSVLLVDDEPLILSGLKALINWDELGLEVCDSANSAAEALKMTQNRNYDIFITDVRMPDMTGLELIAELRRRDISSKILIISGYDDFDYVKCALSFGIENYLVKPIDEEELKTSLAYIVDKIESEKKHMNMHKLTNSLLLDNVLSSWALMALDKDTLRDRLDFLHIKTDSAYYTLGAIRLSRQDQPNGLPDISIESIRDIMRQLCGVGENLYVTYNLSADLLLIYANNQKPSADRLEFLLKNAVSFWLRDTATGWFASFGTVENQAMNLNKSYLSAMNLMFFQYMEPCPMIVIAQRQRMRMKTLLRRLGLSVAWLEKLLLTDEADLDQRLQALHASVRYIRQLPRGEADFALHGIIYCIFSGMDSIRRQLMMNKEPVVDFSPIFHEGYSVDERFSVLFALIRDYAHRNPYGVEPLHPVISRLISSVAGRYDDPGLSLKTLAAEYNVSQTYLGRIFKKETGVLFTDYLCDYRLEIAKKLLLTTTRKSSDIAGDVGFSNPNYFANVFKKKTLVYPTKFRRTRNLHERELT